MEQDRPTASLLTAARELFAERGYAQVNVEELTLRARVSVADFRRSFPAGKEQLFGAVVVRLSAELASEVRAEAAEASGPWEALERGINAFLDASTRSEVRRILLLDGPLVLGGEVWRALDTDYGLALLEGALKAAIDAAEMPPQNVAAAARVLLEALEDAALTIACADDPRGARVELGGSVERLLAGLKTPLR